MAVKKGVSVWYRIVGRRRRTPEDALPSLQGRFHDQPAAEPTSYGAESLFTAWREVSAHFGAVPAKPNAFRGWKVTIDTTKCKLVDLRDRKELARFAITESELLADVASPKCREAARRIRAAGFDGIIYQSVRNPAGVCVALFLEHSAAAIRVEPVLTRIPGLGECVAICDDDDNIYKVDDVVHVASGAANLAAELYVHKVDEPSMKEVSP